MPKLPAKENEYYLGVDIGVNGGVAVLDSRGRAMTYSQYPPTPIDFQIAISELRRKYPITRAVVEKIWAFKGTSKTTAFSMGYNLGVVESCLSFYEIPYSLVAAVTWQKKLNLPSRAGGQLDNKDHKERLRKIAQKMFPSLPLWKMGLGVQRAICDSLLIADHCRRENVKGA